MNIIALYGPKNVGKTSTLKEFVRLLSAHYSATATVQVQQLPDHDPTVDIQLIVTITTVNGTVNVGVESQGDPGGRLEPSLQILVNAQCDIIFCATRTRGATCDAVDALRPLGYSVDWVQQVKEYNQAKQAASNAQQAIVLLTRLKALVP